MKIGRALLNGFVQTVIISHGQVLDVPDGLGVLQILNMPRKDRDFIEGQAGRRMKMPLHMANFVAPIEPHALRDFVSFEGHIAGMKKSEGGTGKVPDAWYEIPVFVFQNPWTITAPNADIPMPPNCERLDYELEIAAVILKKAKDVSEAEARDYIAGYTIWNDWSARDVQKREMAVGLGPSKGKDFANTLGPWIATVDEFKEDKYVDGRLSLDMKVTVNGELYGHDNSKMMSWSFEQLLVHASRASVVGPGDVLGSGTASNGGSLAEQWSRNGGPTPAPLKVGDVVEMEIEGLGSIKNTIVATDSPNHQIPRAVRTYSEDQL